MVLYGTKQPLVMVVKDSVFIGIQTTHILQKAHKLKTTQPSKSDNIMQQYNIGDFVCMGNDKYEDVVYGIIISYEPNNKMYRIFWLDGHVSTPEFAKSFSLVGGQHE